MVIEAAYDELTDLRILAERSRAKRIEMARKGHLKSFCELVMINEESGLPIEMAPFHMEWHQLADKYNRLLIWSAIEHGKTQQMAVARTLWDLGRNPNLRNVICSSTKGQAKKIARSIKGYIEGSEPLRAIFPDLTPGTPWGESDFTVQRTSFAKDPSVQCTGLHGNILGARIDRLVLDDILNYENTRTSHARKDVKNWVKSTLLGRLTKNAQVRNIGNAWHPEDLLHEFAKMKSWNAFSYSALLPDGTPRWPEAWNAARLEAKLEELGPIEYARQLLCQARDDSSSTFKRLWIERCLELGDGRVLAQALSVIPRGYQVYTGVDLAVQKKDASDLTVLFTIAIDPFGQRHVLEIDSDKLSGPEIVNKIKSVHKRFGSIVIVENNAAQDFILQFTRGSSAVPIKAFTTGRNKADPSHGVQSLATEMYNGKWTIPSAENGQVLHPEVAAWVDEMLYYDPAGHTGDRLMASWFAREGARMSPATKIIVKKKPDLMRR